MRGCPAGARNNQTLSLTRCSRSGVTHSFLSDVPFVRAPDRARNRARAHREGMDGTNLRVYGLNSPFRPLRVLNTDKRRIHTPLQGNRAQAVVSVCADGSRSHRNRKRPLQGNRAQAVVSVAIRTQGFSSRAGRSGSVPASGGLALLRPAVQAGLKAWDAPRCAADGAMPMSSDFGSARQDQGLERKRDHRGALHPAAKRNGGR